MNQGKIRRILIIDDHPLLRKGLRQLADFNSEIEIIGEADNGEQGLALARQLKPELVLLDLFMPGMSGLEVLKNLKDADRPPQVIMLTVSDAQEDAVAALRAGADGYLLKDMDPEELLSRLCEIEADGQFSIISQTDPVPGDAWTDFLPESAILVSDWPGLDCGMYNTETETCVQIESNY